MVAVGLSAPFISRHTARAAQGIAVAAVGDWFQPAFGSVVLAPFRKAHPEIQIVHYGVTSASQILTTLRIEHRFPSLDVVLLSAAEAAQAMKQGLLDPVALNADGPAATAAGTADPAAAASPVLMWDSLAIGYNPALVAQPPRAWRDLWNLRFGRLAVQTPPDPAAIGLTVAAATIFGGRNNPQALGSALTALSALSPRIVLRDPRPDMAGAIAWGEAAIGPVWNARAQFQAAGTPGRFAAMLPDEGSPVQPITINLVKGSRQAAAARALIAYLLSAEAQRLIAETLFFAPATQDGIPPIALSRVGATPAMEARRISMGWADDPAIRQAIETQWRQLGLAMR